MKKVNFSNVVLFLISVLLVLQTVNYYHEKAQNVDRFNRVQNCYKSQIDKLDSLSLGTTNWISENLNAYNEDVYKNNKIDRIAEQQLISSEYNLAALQHLSLQNIEILSIIVNLSVCDGYR